MSEYVDEEIDDELELDNSAEDDDDDIEFEIEEDDDDDFVIINKLSVEDTKNVKLLTEKKKKGPKPKLIGKHSLSQDTIFRSKKNEVINIEDEESEYIIKNAGGSLDINDDYIGDVESKSNIDYFRETELKNHIYRVLSVFTDLDFHSPIRKPSKVNFNNYFKILIDELSDFGYSKSEIFIELSGYFTTDKIWNIFKLLDKEYSNDIIGELKNKFGLTDLEKIDFM